MSTISCPIVQIVVAECYLGISWRVLSGFMSTPSDGRLGGVL